MSFADVIVLLKWVAWHPEVDALSGAVMADRHGGLSAADEAALELGLELAAAEGTSLGALSAGPPVADEVLRLALAAGARSARRIDLPADASSAWTAGALAASAAGARWVLGGDFSLDRGSGSVPGLVAGLLDAAQALGVATMEISGAGRLRVERRLDAGWREEVELAPPAVIAVDGGAARLRRPGLGAALGAGRAPIDVVTPSVTGGRAAEQAIPFRPRPRVLPGPPADMGVRDRLVTLSGALTEPQAPQLVTLEPEAAATAILGFLAQRGYELPPAVGPEATG